MKSKYEEVRIDGKRYLKHRYIWEQHNGPIPDGYEVHHKDLDSHNNDIANLELMAVHDHRSYHSKRQTGRKLSEETKDKIRQKHLGIKDTEETRRKKSDAYSRKIPVVCVETGEEFDTIQDAARFIGRERRGIYGCLRDKNRTSGGYHWKRKKE